MPFINYHTIARIVRKLKATGQVAREQVPGRPKSLTEEDKRRLFTFIKRDPHITLIELKQHFAHIKVSTRTIQRAIKANPFFKRCRTKRKPKTSPSIRKMRLGFARCFLKTPKRFARKILFSDESPMPFKFCPKRTIIKNMEDSYNPEYIEPTVKHEKRVMVWGCFSYNGVGKLTQVKGIMDAKQYKQILIHHAFPSGKQLFGTNTWYFQHDNDPKHTSKIVQTYLDRKDTSVLKWPPYSPDLNPIENLWHIMKNRIEKRDEKTEEEFLQELQTIWNNIPAQTLRNLIDSMRDRCEEVIKAKGYPTRY